MQLDFKLTLDHNDNKAEVAAMLRRFAVALDGKETVASVTERVTQAQVVVAVPPAVALAAGETAAVAKVAKAAASKAAAPTAPAAEAPAKRGPGRPPKNKTPPPPPSPAEADDEGDEDEDVEAAEPWEPRRNERAAAPAKGKGKPAPAEADDEEEDDDEDLEGLGLDDESDADPAHKGKLTYEADLLPAIIAFGKSFDKDVASTKVKAVLKKFNVVHPRDIPEDQIAAVLKEIAKAK